MEKEEQSIYNKKRTKINTCISITTTNINDLKSPIKKHRLTN
jgi:hypothetical protein